MNTSFIATGGATPATLPPVQDAHSENYQFKCETKEIRATLMSSFNRHLPGVRNFKLKRSPGSGLTIMRARYGKRTIYAMAYNLCDCFVRFMREYETKVVSV